MYVSFLDLRSYLRLNDHFTIALQKINLIRYNQLKHQRSLEGKKKDKSVKS